MTCGRGENVLIACQHHSVLAFMYGIVKLFLKFYPFLRLEYFQFDFESDLRVVLAPTTIFIENYLVSM